MLEKCLKKTVKGNRKFIWEIRIAIGCVLQAGEYTESNKLETARLVYRGYLSVAALFPHKQTKLTFYLGHVDKYELDPAKQEYPHFCWNDPQFYLTLRGPRSARQYAKEYLDQFPGPFEQAYKKMAANDRLMVYDREMRHSDVSDYYDLFQEYTAVSGFLADFAEL